MEASKKGDVEAAQRVLEVTSDANVEDDSGWTPLLYASSHGFVKLVRLLVHHYEAHAEYKQRRSAHFADPDLMDGEMSKAFPFRTNSPLHWAAYRGQAATLWFLLISGYSAADLDVSGNTGLHLAAMGGSVQCVETMMSQGFDLAARNDLGNTVLHVCSSRQCASLLRKARSQKQCTITGKCGCLRRRSGGGGGGVVRTHARAHAHAHTQSSAPTRCGSCARAAAACSRRTPPSHPPC